MLLKITTQNLINGVQFTVFLILSYRSYSLFHYILNKNIATISLL